MNKPFGNAAADLEAYVSRTYQPEDAVLAEIRERSGREGLPDIQVAALDGRHLEILARIGGCRRAAEVGTLGGFSGVCILRGLVPDGTLDTVELSPHHAAVAAESFQRAGFATRARIHVGAARDILPTLRKRGPFDLVFIDADKENYAHYVEWAAANLRPGGIVIADNAFLFGRLPADPATAGDRAPTIEAMQSMHALLARGDVFRATVLPTGEGLAVGVRL